MGRFVTVDSGTYFSTPSISLMDAASSHIHQGVGQWSNWTNTNVSQSMDKTPVIGGYVLKGANAQGGIAACEIGTDTGTDGYAVFASTEYSLGLRLWSPAVSARTEVRVYYYDSGGGEISSAIVFTEWNDNAETDVDIQVTTPALTAYVSLSLKAINLAVGDALYADAIMLALGSDSTFYPSLNIAANDTYTKDPAPITAAYASSVLKVGDGWAGDAKTVTLQDGVGGPIVAKFDADDPSTVGDMDTWTDDTGRTWTMNGVGASIGYTERNPNKMATPGQLLRTGG